MTYLTAEKLQTYLTYLLPNLIFIHLIQDHLQEVIISYVKRHSRLDKQTKSFSRYGVSPGIVYRVECLKCPKITLKSMSTTVYSEYFQKKTIILIYPTYL